MKFLRIVTGIGLLFCLNTFFNSAQAHPQPLVVQEIQVNYSEKSVDVQINIHIDPIVVDQIYPLIDTDRNDEISDAEINDFSVNTILKHTTSRLNNRDAVLQKIGHQTLKKNEIQSLDDHMAIAYTVQSPVIRETNSFYFMYDKKFMEDDSYGDLIVFTDNIAENPDKLERIETNQDKTIAPVDYLVDYKILNFGVVAVPTKTPDTVKESVKPNAFSEFISSLSSKSTELTNQARNYNFKQGGIKLFLLSLVITFIAGALHAVTPGHGKSLMAAFLIGKRESKVVDVIILGLSITLAHTAVIYILGFVLLSLKMTASAPQVTYYIEKVSSVLLIVLAILLIRNALRSYRHYKSHVAHGEDPNHDHHHDHEHSHDNGLVHDHGFGPHTHYNKKIRIRSRWDLFYAGISGGIVPCLDALSILFVAVNLGKIGIGLLMIFFFSLGLASAIIAMGLLLIYGRDKLNLEKKFGSVAQFYAPIISGVVILVIATIYLVKK